MCIVLGNQGEQTTGLPLESSLTRMLQGKQFIYCADAGLSSYHIRKFNSMGGRAFVVTQSVKKLADTLQNMQVDDMEGICYRSAYKGSEVLDVLNKIYPLSSLDKRYYLPKDLNKKFKKISR